MDSTGAASVAGLTFSGNFPLVNSLLEPAGGFYPYLTKLNPAGSELVYSSLLGIGGSASGVAVDTLGNAYVTGTVTNGAGFPVTAGAAETSLPAGAGSVFTAFVVKIGGPPGTVTGLRSSASPSVFGQQATFTATVTPSMANSNIPTGAVIFADGATTLGAINLANGTATFSTTGLGVGSHSITASYFGDSLFAGSVSTTLTQLVSQAATTTALQSSLNPANFSQTVTFTVSVTPVAPGAGSPTGTVTFLDAAGSPTGTASVNSGVATLATSTLSAGSHTISASYGGDANFAASASAGFTQVIATLQPLSIVVTESIKVTDNPVLTEGLPPLAIIVTESIRITDNPVLMEGLAPLSIAVTESIRVTDVPVLAQGPAPLVIAVTESIKVTDTPILTEAGNAAVGSNVVTQPVDPATHSAPVTLTFSNVTQPGVVNLTTSASGPSSPSGFEAGNPASYYELTTTASFSGTITVCINYTGVSFQNQPALFHYENGTWVNRTTTVNTNTNTVCGVVSSLSPFALFQAQVSPTPPATPPVTTSFSTYPSGLNLQYVQGTLPSSFPQTFSVSSIPSGVPFTVVSSASWLMAPPGASTAVTYIATLNLTGLAPGNYGAMLNFTSANGSVQVPVSLTVLPPPALLSQPSAPQLMANFGAAAGAADIQLTSATSSIAFTASSNVPWLTFTASSGTTPATQHLQANPTGLPAAVYQGAIIVTESGAANSPYSVPVSFVVGGTGVAGQSAIDNSASFGSGLAAPNSILTLFGVVGCSSNPQVLVNGTAAQILFAGATQINFVAPGAPGVVTSTTIQLLCNGASMETATVQTAQVDPAIFTQTGTGTGPGSIVNQDGSLNGAGKPASPGGYISVYVTGFGTYNPSGPDGLQRLTYPVTAMIGGVAADVLYAGEAPTETSGLQQVNIQIPASAHVGPNVPIVLTVAGVSTQNGVTVAIQ